ncbi:MAG: 50S ribosomal protein L21 [Bryobacteraceae bacterium]|nr:50S ribosomal protein L21 [Bryobacteraceae bacterium]
MYAVIETGGKQYRVTPGDVIHIDTLSGDNGAQVEFDRVLAVSQDGGAMLAGAAAAAARVRGTIQKHHRGDKVIVFKFKRKKQYKRTIGHRRNLTAVQISEIVV